MERKQPDLELFFELPNPGLWAYFQRTVNGNQDDYRPPFWKGKSREEVLAMWQEVFDRLGVKEMYPSLYEYEMEMKGKVGPMSIQLPLKDRLESIEAYFTGVEGNPDPIPQEAIDATVRFFGNAKGIRLRSRSRTAAEMRLSTNSGNPWFTKRRRVIEQCLKSTITVDADGVVWMNIKGKRYQACAILGWRGQEGGMNLEDVKQRVVWMMSVLLNLYELQFYQPAIAAMQQHNLIPAYVSMDAVDRQVTLLFDTKGADDEVIGTDFSRFDQHFNVVMQDAAESVMRALATLDGDMEWWFNNIYPAKFRIPIICSEDIAFFGPHGMGSGSGGTNFDECMAHKTLQFDACQKKGTELNPYSMAYGDDGILSAPGLSVDDVIRAYESHGMVMNPEKQYVSKHDCIFLRRWHSDSYRDKDGIMVGVYATFRALGRLLAQERYYDPEEWGPEQVTLRAWSILENCNHSPYFEEFVQFVLKGDKYRLGLDLPGFIDNIDQVAKKSIEQLPDFLGYTKSMQYPESAFSSGGRRGSRKVSHDLGIRKWRIYNYLVSLR